MGDDDELKRAIEEYENRPVERPPVLSEERRERIRAECERRGTDADGVIAECERRGYWEWFDCGDADDEADPDDQPLLMPALEMPDFTKLPHEDLVVWLRDLHEQDLAVRKIREGLGTLRRIYTSAGHPEPNALVWYRVQLEADTVAAGIEPPSMVSQCILAAHRGGLNSEQLTSAMIEAGVSKHASPETLEKNLDQRNRETSNLNAAMKRAAKIPTLSVISTIRRMVP